MDERTSPSKSPTPTLKEAITSMPSYANTIPSFHSILSNFQRCFVEDFMCLAANEPCIILVSLSSVGHCNHYMYLINYSKNTATIKVGNKEFYVCHCSV